MYSDIPLRRFLIGGAVVVAPLAILDRDWGWRYALLILVMFSVYNWRGLSRFWAFVSQEVR